MRKNYFILQTFYNKFLLQPLSRVPENIVFAVNVFDMSIVYKELQSGLDFCLADSTILAKKAGLLY